MTHSQHLMHTGKECLCLKSERRAASLPPPPTGKERCYTDLYKRGIAPSHGWGCYLPGEHSGAPTVFSFKRKPVSCCFWIQCLLTAVWRHIPPHGQLLHSFTVFAKLACLTEHIHCSIPCTKPLDSFLKCLCVSVCT